MGMSDIPMKDLFDSNFVFLPPCCKQTMHIMQIHSRSVNDNYYKLLTSLNYTSTLYMCTFIRLLWTAHRVENNSNHMFYCDHGDVYMCIDNG